MRDLNPASYGAGFNAAGGGVFAVLFAETGSVHAPSPLSRRSSSLLTRALALQYLDLALEAHRHPVRHPRRLAEVGAVGRAGRRVGRLDVRHEDVLQEAAPHLCASSPTRRAAHDAQVLTLARSRRTSLRLSPSLAPSIRTLSHLFVSHPLIRSPAGPAATGPARPRPGPTSTARAPSPPSTRPAPTPCATQQRSSRPTSRSTTSLVRRSTRSLERSSAALTRAPSSSAVYSV